MSKNLKASENMVCCKDSKTVVGEHCGGGANWEVRVGSKQIEAGAWKALVDTWNSPVRVLLTARDSKILIVFLRQPPQKGDVEMPAFEAGHAPKWPGKGGTVRHRNICCSFGSKYELLYYTIPAGFAKAEGARFKASLCSVATLVCDKPIPANKTDQ